jgi:recombination protein RecR
MESFPPALKSCLEELQKLPGIGPRSAQRILFHLLMRGGAAPLSEALTRLENEVERCPECRAYRDVGSECPLCDNPRRDPSVLCVVESPGEVYLVESTGEFGGLYHVLHGLLSPLRGVSPEALGLDTLVRRIREREVQEVILATSPTAEGEATASYITEILKGKISKVSRIGFGLPVGSDLQYVDAQTLSRALTGRRDLL